MSEKLKRKGIPEDIRYYFAEKEPIWYIGESLSERKELNESLNRETIKIDNLNELIQQVELALVNGNPVASLVIMPRIGIDLEKNLTTLKAALNAMPYVKVYEINRDPLFEYGQSVPSLYKLKEYSYDKTRSITIRDYIDPSDRQAELLKSLELDLEVERKKSINLRNNIETKDSEILELNNQIKELTFDIDEKYKYKIDSLTRSKEKLEELLSSTNIDLSTERNKIEDLMNDLNNKTNELSSLKYQYQALERKLENQKNKYDSQKLENKKLEDRLDSVSNQFRKIQATTVDEETFIYLKNEIEEKETSIKMLNDEISEMHITVKEKEFKIKELENIINKLRSGQNDIMATGRTSTLDTAIFKNIPLVYIKVFEELPFLKLYIARLFETIKVDKNLKNGLLIVLKNDDGMDKEIFKGLGVLSNFNDLSVDYNKYRLFPSSTMFNGIDFVDKNYDFVVFVDYLKTDKYYLSSLYNEVYMTSVSHSKKIKEFNLKGKAISLDSDSIVKIKYNTLFDKTAVKENRDLQVTKYVTEWYRRLDL